MKKKNPNLTLNSFLEEKPNTCVGVTCEVQMLAL